MIAIVIDYRFEVSNFLYFIVLSFKIIPYLGLQNYFKDSWNVFDFITVVGSIIDVLVTEIKVFLSVCSRFNSVI